MDIEVKNDAMATRMQQVPGLVAEGRRQISLNAPTVSAALSLAWRGISEVFHEPADWLK